MKLFENEKGIVIHFQTAPTNVIMDTVKRTADIKEVSGYIIGMCTILTDGMSVSKLLAQYTSKPVIFDPCGGLDDDFYDGEPEEYERETAKAIARNFKAAMPLLTVCNPQNIEGILKALPDAGLVPIVKAELTTPDFLEYFAKEKEPIKAVCKIAARHGADHFWVPANDPERIKTYRQLIEAETDKPVCYLLYSAFNRYIRFENVAAAAGPRWQAVAEREVWGARDPRASALELAEIIRRSA